MAKTRMLKHDLRTSEKVASWPIELRYFWVLLWGYVDDHGKGKDNPLLVKADCFPLDETITRATVDQWLWDLAEAGVIVRYSHGGDEYLAIKHWSEHQKPPHPTKDVLPAFSDPQSTARELHAPRMKDAGKTPAPFTNGLGRTGFEFGSGFVNESSPPAMVSTFHPVYNFDDFWAIWPRKEGKADALKAWNKAIGKHSQDAIVDAAREYAEHPDRPAKQFVPHGATWLNGERWNDGPPTAPEERSSKPTPEQRAYQTMSLAMDIDMKEIE